MERHVTAIAALQIGYSVLGILIGILALLLLGTIGVASQDETALFILTTIGMIAGGLFIFLSVPAIIGAIGLLKYRNWGRVLTLIVSAFEVLSIPFGTALAVYTIWVLVHPDTQRLFAEAATASFPKS